MDRKGKLLRVWGASWRARELGTTQQEKTSKRSSAEGSRDLGGVWVCCFDDKQEKRTLSRYSLYLTLDSTEN